MGHTMQFVRGKFEYFRDVDLLALFYVMNVELEANSSAHPNMGPIVAQWIQECPLAPIGCMELDLDTVASKEPLRQEFLSFLSALEQRVAVYGDNVPADELNEWYPSTDLEFDEFPTWLLIRTIESLRKLMEFRGQEPPQLYR